MKNLLIGSRAIKIQNPNFKLKDTADFDVISINPIEGSEHHQYDFLNNYEFERYSTNEYITLNNNKLHIVNLKGLAIIKRSHLWRPLSFDKHITMFHKYLAPYITNIDETDKLILFSRINLSEKAFPQHKIKLNKSVKDFFDDAVTKKYDHDILHEIVAYHDKPLYTKMQNDSSIAMCYQNKWNEFIYEDKCKCVSEETMVIAIERFLVPNDWNYPYKLAYLKALEKVCTTLTSGWFRDFAIDNYPLIVNLFDANKFDNAKNKLP